MLQVYQMSSDKRGRALFISNAYSSCPRNGSEHDFNNLKVMFEKFLFDVVGEHKDYTARVKLVSDMNFLFARV